MNLYTKPGYGMSRRSMLRACAAGFAGSALGKGRRLKADTVGARDIMVRPVDVPRDFAGIHFHKWPQGAPLSPPPTYGYGTVRSHDYGVPWNSIHMAPNAYRWDRMDTWVRAHSAAGKTLIYTLYGTPTWLSTRPSVRDNYGQGGAGSPPRDYKLLADFISALISRYNSGARRAIQYLELWNEPHFLENERGFWWGSANQLAELCKTASTAARNADPQIRILSPGFDALQPGPFSANVAGVAASLRDFLAARDGTGQPAHHHLDGLAIHTYNAHILQPATGLEGMILQAQDTLATLGIELPLFTTETGYFRDPLFTGETQETQAVLLRRQAAVQAARGVKSVCFYSHDDDYCGNPATHPVVAAALDQIHKQLAGTRLEQVTIWRTGELEVHTSTGSYKC